MLPVWFKTVSMVQGWGRMQAILDILVVHNSFKDHSEVGHREMASRACLVLRSQLIRRTKHTPLSSGSENCACRMDGKVSDASSFCLNLFSGFDIF